MARDLEIGTRSVEAERPLTSTIDIVYGETHQAIVPAKNVFMITADLGTYKPYSGYVEAFADLLKDPIEFDANYEEFYSPEARIADWVRIGGDVHIAWFKTLCGLLGEPNVER